MTDDSLDPVRHSRGAAVPDPASRAVVLLDTLIGCGASHIIGLPDNTSAALFRAAEECPSVTVLTVTREGEAFAVASGLWVGGQTPVVVVQNTGLLESGDSLRGTAVRMSVPLLCIVTYRGYGRMVGAGVTPPDDRPRRVDLTRPDLDSVALVTEPTLEAWGIPYDVYHTDGDIDRVREAWNRAEREARPVAILLTRALT